MDNRLTAGQNTTSHTYAAVSNVATVTAPNGLSSTFSYDELNRLKSTNGYQYTLGATGNRQSATEPNGRALSWTYDGVNRLTNETISLDPRSKNGAVSYGLDPVGNRLSQTSTLAGITSGSATFDANDRLSTETYDANGNTTVSGARTFAYDFDNRLKSMNSGAVTLVYDGDGNRVAKTVSGVTTRYLVDDLNPTGYAQVLEELTGSAVSRRYTYGSQRIGQNQLISSVWTPSFYGYDGGGHVRTLTDATGTVTDTYDYDAWGNAVDTTGTTPNAYLYRGEQYDADLNLYYLRDRYLNPITGRFLSKDPAEGAPAIPNTFHKYLYAATDPTNRVDPSGRQNVAFYTTMVAWVVPTATALGVAEAAVTSCLGGYVITGLAAAAANLLPGYEVEQMQIGPCMFTYRVRPRTRDVAREPKPWYDPDQHKGDCPGYVQAALETEVHMSCDVPRSCKADLERWPVIWHTATNTKCFNARLHLMAACFRGGDAARPRKIESVN